MRHRPIRKNYDNGIYGDIDYLERLERYCTFLENKEKQLILPVVSNIEERKSICPNCYDNKVANHREYNKETCVKCGFQWQIDC